MMSEWVLKPKATVLVVLGCVLIYDLKTKTQDVVALRVYRGELDKLLNYGLSNSGVAQYHARITSDFVRFIPRPGTSGVYIVHDCILLTDLAEKWSSV